MVKICLGPAGSEGKGNEKGILEARSLGAKCYEVEFTHGVNMKKEQAIKVGEIAKEAGVKLSIHAPYFINLLTPEKEKYERSKNHIIKSAIMGEYMNAREIVFHPGYYLKLSKEEAYERMKDAIQDLLDTIKDLGLKKIILAPETTGKPTQFGSVEELLNLMKDFNNKIGICVDFAHLKARTNGKADWDEILAILPKKFHSHFSGIVYSEKGEKHHIPIDEKEFEYLLSLLKKHDKEVSIINESPEIFADLKKMIKIAEKMKLLN